MPSDRVFVLKHARVHRRTHAGSLGGMYAWMDERMVQLFLSDYGVHRWRHAAQFRSSQWIQLPRETSPSYLNLSCSFGDVSFSPISGSYFDIDVADPFLRFPGESTLFSAVGSGFDARFRSKFQEQTA